MFTLFQAKKVCLNFTIMLNVLFTIIALYMSVLMYRLMSFGTGRLFLCIMCVYFVGIKATERTPIVNLLVCTLKHNDIIRHRVLIYYPETNIVV